MGFVADNLEVLEAITEDVFRLAMDLQCRQRQRLATQLQLRLLQMITVEMSVAPGPDEVAHFKITLLGDPVGQQRIGGDIERNAQKSISGALVELTRRPAVSHIE